MRRRGVVLVDRHEPHLPAAPVPARDRSAETSAVGHSLRDLVHGQDTATIHNAGNGDRLEAREVQFEDMAPLTYDYLVLGLGAEVPFFGTEGAPELPSRCTRCPMPCA